MVKTETDNYQAIYDKNLHLLEIARQGKWDEFAVLVEDYVVKLQDLLQCETETLSGDEKAKLREVLTRLKGNEEEITRVLQDRLNVLRKDISALHRGRQCNQAYSPQSLSAWH